MKPLPATPALIATAQRVVWFLAPDETLGDPVNFLAYVMTYGTVDDLRALQDVVGPDEFRQALAEAPPGVFDGRSWAYWHLRYGKQPAPPLPTRALGISTHEDAKPISTPSIE